LIWTRHHLPQHSARPSALSLLRPAETDQRAGRESSPQFSSTVYVGAANIAVARDIPPAARSASRSCSTSFSTGRCAALDCGHKDSIGRQSANRTSLQFLTHVRQRRPRLRASSTRGGAACSIVLVHSGSLRSRSARIRLPADQPMLVEGTLAAALRWGGRCPLHAQEFESAQQVTARTIESVAEDRARSAFHSGCSAAWRNRLWIPPSNASQRGGGTLLGTAPNALR